MSLVEAGNVGEVVQDVSHDKVQRNLGPRVAALQNNFINNLSIRNKFVQKDQATAQFINPTCEQELRVFGSKIIRIQDYSDPRLF